MEKRKTLISDIKNFIEKSNSQDSCNEPINKSEYLILLRRISEIEEKDFDDLEKYNHFLKFLNEPSRIKKRVLVQNSFDKNNFNVFFLNLINDLEGICNWLDN